MKHLAAIFGALLLLAFATVVVVPSALAHSLTVPQLGFAGVCIAIAFALAIPADFKAAITTVAPYILLVHNSNAPPSAP